jgi:16S rRNA U1498 N3-methylase RsmE
MQLEGHFQIDPQENKQPNVFSRISLFSAIKALSLVHLLVDKAIKLGAKKLVYFRNGRR